MIDLATVGYAVDTRGLAAGDAALDAFTGANERAAEAARHLGTTATASGQHVRELSVQARNGQQHISNLSAQINDIGVMLAAGQSPFMLAVQQGTQINQVFREMGGGVGAVKAMGVALMSMINPMSLATIAFIGLGATGVQWLMNLGEEAEDFADVLSDVEKQIKAVDEAQKAANVTFSQMGQAFGNYSPLMKDILNDMLALEKIKLADKFSKEAKAIKEMVAVESFWSDREQTSQAQDFLGLSSIGLANQRAAESFLNLNIQLQTAATLSEKLQTAIDLREVLLANAGSLEKMTGEQMAYYSGLGQMITQLQMAGATVDELEKANDSMKNVIDGYKEYAKSRLEAEAEIQKRIVEGYQQYGETRRESAATVQQRIVDAYKQYGESRVQVEAEIQARIVAGYQQYGETRVQSEAAIQARIVEGYRQYGETRIQSEAAAQQRLNEAYQQYGESRRQQEASDLAELSAAYREYGESRRDAMRQEGEVKSATADFERQVALMQQIIHYGEDSVQAAAARRDIEEHNVNLAADQLELTGHFRDQYIEAAMAAYDMSIAADHAGTSVEYISSIIDGVLGTLGSVVGQTWDWETAMAGVLGQINGILGAIAAIGGGMIANAAKFVEIKALKAGESVAGARMEVEKFNKSLEFDARRDAAGSGPLGWVQRKAIDAEEALWNAGQAAESEIKVLRENATEAERAANRKSKAAKKAGGDGAKAAKAAAKEQERLNKELDKSAEKWKDQLDPLNSYKRDLNELADLYETGRLSADEVGKAMKQLNADLADSLPLVGEFVDTITEGLFNGFEGTLESIMDMFKSWLSQMIATAAKNQIIISMGLGVPGVGQAAGGGMLGGLGGIVSSFMGDALGFSLGAAGAGAGGVLGGLGGVWGGITGGWANGGFLGAITGGLGSSFGGIGAGLGAGGLGGIGAAIGSALPLIGGVLAIGGLIKKAFGEELEEAGIDGSFSMRNGIDLDSYEKWDRGWRSDKTFYDDEVPAGMSKMLDTMFSDMAESVTSFAEALGLNTRKINGHINDIKFETAGKSEEEVLEYIQEELAQYGEELAGLVTEGVNGFKRFQQAGETAYDTLARLGTSLIAVNAAFDGLGLTLYDTSLQGANAASRLIEAFGGLENFVSAMDYYMQNFYSLEEQEAAAERRLRGAFEDAGTWMPQTERQFRNMVERLREAGDLDTMAAVLQLAPAFQEWINMNEQLNESMGDPERASLMQRVLELQGDYWALKRLEAEQLDATNRALFWAVTNVERAQEQFRAAAQQEQQRIAVLRQNADSMRSLANTTLAAATTMSEAERKMAERRLRNHLANGWIGENAMELAQQAAQVNAANFTDRTAFLVASAQSAALISQLADEQDARAEEREERLNEALERFGMAEEAIVSLDYAIRRLDITMRRMNEVAGGSSAQTTAPGYAKGGDHEGGLRFVGEQGVELEATGPSRVYSNSQTQDLIGAERMTHEIRDLKAEVKKMREDNNSANLANIKHTKQTSDMVRRWESIGMPHERDA